MELRELGLAEREEHLDEEALKRQGLRPADVIGNLSPRPLSIKEDPEFPRGEAGVQSATRVVTALYRAALDLMVPAKILYDTQAWRLGNCRPETHIPGWPVFDRRHRAKRPRPRSPGPRRCRR